MLNTGRQIKVVIVISNVDKAVGFEWLVSKIDPAKFSLSFILLNDNPSYLAEFLKGKGVPCFELPFNGKRDIPILLIKVLNLLRRIKPDVIHTHLFGANLIGQTAGRILRIPKRIYTRHSSNENRRYHGKQRWDHYTNRLCTDILAISDNVKTVLIREERVSPEKIALIHHGFDLDKFVDVTDEDIRRLAAKYNSGKKRPVIGVISRYSHWKGIQFIVPAFERLLGDYPDALLILANAGRADYSDEIDQMLSGLPNENVCEIEFEPDVFSLYRLFDVYVHVPIDAELEAFGQTYVEALAAGIPSVFTLSGVAPEFIKNRRNAMVVDFQSSDQIYEAILELLKDTGLRRNLIDHGKADVRQKFSLETMIEKLEKLYAR